MRGSLQLLIYSGLTRGRAKLSMETLFTPQGLLALGLSSFAFAVYHVFVISQQGWNWSAFISMFEGGILFGITMCWRGLLAAVSFHGHFDFLYDFFRRTGWVDISSDLLLIVGAIFIAYWFKKKYLRNRKK